jgi:uncharacterized membrane protein
VAAGRRQGKASRHPEVRAFERAIDHDRLVAAIKQAEGRTTGQIRVHLAYHSAGGIEKAARAKFRRLAMAATPDRNAVLIYLAPKSRKLFITGDVGIDRYCNAAFWEHLAGELASALREGRFTEGVEGAVKKVGDVLAEHFSRVEGDQAQPGLPDDVTDD